MKRALWKCLVGPTLVGLACTAALTVFGDEAVNEVTDTALNLEPPRRVMDRGWLTLGWFFPEISSKARLDSDTLGRGTTISFEDDLGYDDNLSEFSVEAGFYFTKRFRVTGEYFALDRSTLDGTTREFTWGDETYEVNTLVASFFDLELLRVALGYDIIQREDWMLGLTVGAHMIDTAIGIGLAANVGEAGGNVSSDASTDGLFPIPNVGLYSAYWLSDHWRVDARIDWFGIDIGEWEGSLWSASAGVRYQFSSYFSIGASFDYFAVNVEYTEDTWMGEADVKFYGPKLNLGLRF